MTTENEYSASALEAFATATEGTATESSMPLHWTAPKHDFPDTIAKKNKEGDIVGYTLLSTIENLAHLCKIYGITIRYNEMAKKHEIGIPGRDFSSDNSDNASLAELTSICRRNAMPVNDVADFAMFIAEQNRYHPFRDYVTSKAWDKQDRIGQLCDTLKVEDRFVEHRNKMVRTWLISAICAAFSMDPEHSFHGVLVLQGLQDAGKTTWTKSLIPQKDVPGGVRTGAHLVPSNKDSVMGSVSHTIVELGELDGNYRKVDINEIKGWLTMPSDQLRLPFAKRDSLFKRRTVFTATVNEKKFLVDQTGNRRWWTVPVTDVNSYHSVDMQQLWAQVLELWRSGERWYLTREENQALARINAEFEVQNPYVELLETYFDFEPLQMNLDGSMPVPKKAIGVNATTLSAALKLGLEGNQTRLTQLGNAMRKLTGIEEPRSVRCGSKVIKGWLMTPKDSALFSA